MFMTDVNDVKIYNLSAGKSLPEVSIFWSFFSWFSKANDSYNKNSHYFLRFFL